MGYGYDYLRLRIALGNIRYGALIDEVFYRKSIIIGWMGIRNYE